MALLTHLRLANLHEPDVSRQSWDPKKSEGRGFSHGRVLQLPGKVLHQVDRGPAQLLGENLITTDLVTSSEPHLGGARVHHAVGCPAHRARHYLPLGILGVLALDNPRDLEKINVVIILRHVANYPINDPGPRLL